MRIHWLQHVPFEGLGSIATWADRLGIEARRTRLFADDPLPALTDFDWLIAMGGPMSVNDTQTLPWLLAEKALLARAVEAGKTVLGICLGAQLIASALKARVYRNSASEIGWFAVAPGTDHAVDDFNGFLPAIAFHWHGETFDLPAGARHLARSQACENQAFALGPRLVGLQFHLETTPEACAALLENCADELKPAPFIQDAATIRGTPEDYRLINASMKKLLDTLLDRTSPA